MSWLCDTYGNLKIKNVLALNYKVSLLLRCAQVELHDDNRKIVNTNNSDHKTANRPVRSPNPITGPALAPRTWGLLESKARTACARPCPHRKHLTHDRLILLKSCRKIHLHGDPWSDGSDHLGRQLKVSVYTMNANSGMQRPVPKIRWDGAIVSYCCPTGRAPAVAVYFCTSSSLLCLQPAAITATAIYECCRLLEWGIKELCYSSKKLKPFPPFLLQYKSVPVIGLIWNWANDSSVKVAPMTSAPCRPRAGSSHENSKLTRQHSAYST